MASDEELMQAASAGDMDAFGELARRHERSAWNAAWRLLGDAGEAEDAAQEAFLKILDAAPRYRPTASFRTYLYRVVTRLCIDRIEKKHPTYLGQMPSPLSAEADPSDAFSLRESANAVRVALDALPARQRAAIILRHYEGLSYQEIAEAMDTSVKSVERLLARARGALRDRLEPPESD